MLFPLSLHPSLPNLTVDKLALILHFMPGGMEGLTLNNWKPHKYIKLTLAYGFCQMVRLIQSKDSIVITRVQYCLGNLRKKSIEVSLFSGGHLIIMWYVIFSFGSSCFLITLLSFDWHVAILLVMWLPSIYHVTCIWLKLSFTLSIL